MQTNWISEHDTYTSVRGMMMHFIWRSMHSFSRITCN